MSACLQLQYCRAVRRCAKTGEALGFGESCPGPKRYRLICVADLPDAGSYDDPDEATFNNPSPGHYEVYDDEKREYVGPTTAEEYDECIQRWSLKKDGFMGFKQGDRVRFTKDAQNLEGVVTEVIASQVPGMPVFVEVLVDGEHTPDTFDATEVEKIEVPALPRQHSYEHDPDGDPPHLLKGEN